MLEPVDSLTPKQTIQQLTEDVARLTRENRTLTIKLDAMVKAIRKVERCASDAEMDAWNVAIREINQGDDHDEGEATHG